MRSRSVNEVLGSLLLIAAMGATAPAAADGMRMRSLGEGLEIGAALSAAQVSNDNFYYQPTAETEVKGLLVSPAGGLKQKFSRGTASLNFGVQIAEFDIASDNSDYTDSQIVGKFNYDGGVRSAFAMEAASLRGHDPFGLDRPDLPQRVLDKWTQNGFEGNYRYGAPSAKLNLEFEGGYATKDYTSNEDSTAFLDHNKLSLSQLLLVNYSPKTAIVFELGEDFVDFDLDPSATAPGLDRDATELRVRTGVRWKATAKTTGDLRIGASRRTLDDSKARIIDGASWKAKISWEPLARTAVTIETFRNSQETVSSDASVIDRRRYSLSFSQGWSKNFRTVLAAGVGEARFIGSATATLPERKDDLDNYALSAIYSFKGSLAVYADFIRAQRDSNRPDRDFTALSAIIGIRVSP